MTAPNRLQPFKTQEVYTRSLLLLSLDFAQPFNPLIGIPSSDSVQWKECARAFIRQNRTFFAGVAIESKTLPDKAEEFIRNDLGQSHLQFFVWWIQHVYTDAPQDRTDLRSWTLALRFARKTPDLWDRLALPAKIADAARRRFNESV